MLDIARCIITVLFWIYSISESLESADAALLTFQELLSAASAAHHSCCLQIQVEPLARCQAPNYQKWSLARLFKIKGVNAVRHCPRVVSTRQVRNSQFFLVFLVTCDQEKSFHVVQQIY